MWRGGCEGTESQNTTITKLINVISLLKVCKISHTNPKIKRNKTHGLDITGTKFDSMS